MDNNGASLSEQPVSPGTENLHKQEANLDILLQHSIRRSIIECLLSNELTVTDIHLALESSKTTIMNHLRPLVIADLVEKENKNPSSVYRIREELRQKIVDYISITPLPESQVRTRAGKNKFIKETIDDQPLGKKMTYVFDEVFKSLSPENRLVWTEQWQKGSGHIQRSLDSITPDQCVEKILEKFIKFDTEKVKRRSRS